MKHYLLLLFVGLCLLYSHTYGQQASASEKTLRAKIAAAPNDSARFGGYLDLYNFVLNVLRDPMRGKAILDTLNMEAKHIDRFNVWKDFYIGEAAYYRLSGEREKALASLYKGLKYAKGGKEGQVYYQIAGIYIDLAAYDKALEICFKAEPYFLKDEKEKQGLPMLYRLFGIAHGMANRNEESESYFLKSYTLAQSLPNYPPQNLLSAMEGVAGIYLKTQQIDKAAPIVDSMVAFSTRQGLPFQMAMSHLQRARLRMGSGKMQAAVADAEKTVALLDSVDDNSTKGLAYNLLSKCYLAVGRGEDAYYALEKSQELYYTVYSAEQDRNVQMVEARFQNEKKLQEIQILTRTKLLSFTAIVGLLLLVGVILLAYNRKRLRLKIEAQQKQLLANELSNAQLLLAQFTDSLIEKNSVIETLMEKSATEVVEENEQDVLSKLLDSTILTGADWEKFRSLFERVHPGFMARLHTTYPNLTAGETRMMVLVRLNLPTKEAAMMLGISPESARKVRQRLRKTLALSEEVELEKFVASL